MIDIPSPREREARSLPAAMILFLAAEQLARIAGTELPEEALDAIRARLHRDYVASEGTPSIDRRTYMTALMGAQVAYETLGNLKHGTHDPTGDT